MRYHAGRVLAKCRFGIYACKSFRVTVSLNFLLSVVENHAIFSKTKRNRRHLVCFDLGSRTAVCAAPKVSGSRIRATPQQSGDFVKSVSLPPVGISRIFASA